MLIYKQINLTYKLFEMRRTILAIFILTLQSCASQAPVQPNLKVNKPNESYYLLQTIDTALLKPPEVNLVILSGFIPTLVANLIISEFIL